MPELRGVTKVYHAGEQRIVALRDVTFTAAQGAFIVLVGPSGCGKTTLLRLLAGLETPTSGLIADPGHGADGGGRRVGYVFQEPRLFPWLTVTQNIGFPLSGRVPPAEVAARVGAVLDMMGLSRFGDLRPTQLSGGMASRVGLARALVTQPSLLLLDEPFGALDAMTRRRLQTELAEIWRRLKPTIVFVTHDVEEAVLLADTVYRMDRGAIAGRYPIAAPRPRDPSHPDVIAMRGRILAELEGLPPAAEHSHSQKQKEACP